MGINMGIGQLGTADFKRKYRWTFEIQGTCGGSVPESFVKVAARPSLTIEETEINFLDARTWIPGKGSWETITVTYLDVSSGQNNALFSWVDSIYQFLGATADVTQYQSSARGTGVGDGYEGLGVMNMYDGCGNVLETWKMKHMFPTTINWGETDYSSSEICEIELTLRYSSVTYEAGSCSTQPESCGCFGCGSNGSGGGDFGGSGGDF